MYRLMLFKSKFQFERDRIYQQPMSICIKTSKYITVYVWQISPNISFVMPISRCGSVNCCRNKNFVWIEQIDGLVHSCTKPSKCPCALHAGWDNIDLSSSRHLLYNKPNCIRVYPCNPVYILPKFVVLVSMFFITHPHSLTLLSHWRSLLSRSC